MTNIIAKPVLYALLASTILLGIYFAILTLVSGWLSTKFPGIDFLAHNSGHLFEDFFSWGGDPHFGPFHIASYILIFYGFSLLAKAWGVLYKAQKNHTLATDGPYARIRHPQYVGFVLIMFGFFLQWPTILTAIMLPILVWMYIRLAKSEEKEAQKEFGETWSDYASCTPAFIPRRKKLTANI